MKRQKQVKRFNLKNLAMLLIFGIFIGLTFIGLSAKAKFDESTAKSAIEINTNFVGKEISPTDRIEFILNRAVLKEEGEFAVLLNETDISALVVGENKSFSYTPKIAPLPTGENKLFIYLVNPSGEWKLLKEFGLRVIEAKEANIENASATTENGVEKTSETTEKAVESGDKTKVSFTPNLNLNVKGENTVLFFPDTSRPERARFADTAGQGNVQIRIERSGWKFNNQFDFAGSSRKAETLRFGELGKRAPDVDLSSYLMTLEKGRFKAQLGHVSFGSQKHLVNSFSSRGLSLTIPLGKQNDVTFSAMNGTSIVGFDNFVGVTRAKHQVVGLTFAREFFKEQPGDLRFEVTAMRGSLLPISGFNEGAVIDAEKSYGGAMRLLFKNKLGFKEDRIRFEGGFTRSRFTNPRDPNLEEGQSLTPIRAITKNARFFETSFDFLQGLKLWGERKLKITGTMRHEEIQPLFRSVVASTQADRRNYQFEVTTTFGEMNFSYGNLRDRDNLNGLDSILKTLNRQNNIVFGIPLNSFFTPSKPLKFLPRIGYTYTHVHQFGAFFPTNGDFRDLSQIPDQDSFSQAINADWQFGEKFRVGYRYNRAFQDNKQLGRENSDFLSAVNAINIGTQFHKNFDLNFDLSQERQKNFEESKIERQFRFGTNIVWRDTLLKNLALSANLSTTLAGDKANTNDTRNAEFDIQLAYKFEFGKQKFKKMSAQFFIRYANRYGSRFDRVFLLNDFNKNQAFNAGLTFSLF